MSAKIKERKAFDGKFGSSRAGVLVAPGPGKRNVCAAMPKKAAKKKGKK